MTDLETMMRVLPRSEAHVVPARPRRREYVLMAIVALLVIAAL